MRRVLMDGRLYRTTGDISPISGRLVDLEYQKPSGEWRRVKNPSRRDEVLNILERIT